MSKQIVEASARDIELAMRNAKPRSYYVCRAEDLTQRTSFAHRLRVYDLQLITEQTYISLVSNPSMRLQFPVCFDPETKPALAEGRLAERAAELSPIAALPSPHTPDDESPNPGGSA